MLDGGGPYLDRPHSLERRDLLASADAPLTETDGFGEAAELNVSRRSGADRAVGVALRVAWLGGFVQTADMPPHLPQKDTDLLRFD